MVFNLEYAKEAQQERKYTEWKWNKVVEDCSYEDVLKLPTHDVAAVANVIEEWESEAVAELLITLVNYAKGHRSNHYEDGFTDAIYAIRDYLDSGNIWDYADKKLLEGSES